jgi:arylsulfatase A-like enzyme/L,D-peptidoglycan transpeptidase YkuD (ErfK/YbiS/YcfS/YnhG family)
LLVLALVPAWAASGSSGWAAAAQPASTTVTAAPSGPVSEGQPLDPRPNIVLITTDDQREDDLRHMPFTRALIGAQGTTFTNAIAPFPLCCPSRATILTGQHAHNHGVLSNLPSTGGAYHAFRSEQAETLAVWLQRAGYLTTFAGKYLNGYPSFATEVPSGWTHWRASVGSVYNYFDQKVSVDGEVVARPGIHQSTLFQQYVDEAIEEGTRDHRPFFIWQSHLAPHHGCLPSASGACTSSPPEGEPQDDDFAVNLPLVSLKSAAFNERAVADKPGAIQAAPRLGSAQVRGRERLHQARVRSLKVVDRSVRATVGLLEEKGELDNTLIIFTSDNGFLLGEHRVQGKVLPYEESLRVPLLMRGPGVQVGAVTDAAVGLADIAPTALEVSAALPGRTLDGRSLLPVSQGAPGYEAMPIEAGAVHDAERGEYLYHGVRTRRWVYVEYPTRGEEELYDLALDPDQSDNVAYRPTHQETRAALRRTLDTLRFCAGEACRTASGRAPAPAGPQGPVHPDELAGLEGATQLVTVTANRWDARTGTLVAWQKQERSWRAARGPLTVRLGRNGMARPSQVVHQRSRTRAGMFTVDRALGVRPAPGGEVRYRQLDSGDRWPFDPQARSTYNVFQPRRPVRPTWRPTYEEVFWRNRPAFAYALVLDHNLPQDVRRDQRRRLLFARTPAAVPGGSLLLHTGDRVGRHGWVSLPTAELRWLTRWARPRTQGTRFAVGTVDFLRNRL